MTNILFASNVSDMWLKEQSFILASKAYILLETELSLLRSLGEECFLRADLKCLKCKYSIYNKKSSCNVGFLLFSKSFVDVTSELALL